MPSCRCVAVSLAFVLSIPNGGAQDWPMLGRDSTRNPVSIEKNPPTWWRVYDEIANKPLFSKNIKWIAELGDDSDSCTTRGDPVVAGGLVWVGTTKRVKAGVNSGTAAALMCFRERDGKLLYEYISQRKDEYINWNHYGHSSSPLVIGDRVWFTTISSEVICLDLGPMRRLNGRPKILWKMGLGNRLGVKPGPIACGGYDKTCSVAVYKDRIYLTTGNGTDGNGKCLAPHAPTLVCLDKKTGKLLWSDNSANDALRAAHPASPLVVILNGKAQVIASQGDTWLRSFDALSGKLVWKFDTNPPEARLEKDENEMSSNIVATPVYYKGRVYVANGRSAPLPSTQMAWLYCVDPGKSGNISPHLIDKKQKIVRNPNSGLIWRFGGSAKPRPKIGRNFQLRNVISSVAVHKNLVIALDNDGYVNCLDAKNGKLYWKYDTLAELSEAPLIVDDKIYVATVDGEVLIFNLSVWPQFAMRKVNGRDAPIATLDMWDNLDAAPVFANGVLYVATGHRLFAIERRK